MLLDLWTSSTTIRPRETVKVILLGAMPNQGQGTRVRPSRTVKEVNSQIMTLKDKFMIAFALGSYLLRMTDLR